MNGTGAVPDALAFTAQALARRGALLEPGEAGDEVLALLPPELSRELGLAEEVRLSTVGDGN
ncbi:hypothetical protein, partial [Archangium sp.]|uniref:hypothetical protein n=1 Tax=Archangium sp. TaxID=1872627 RepID=UPI002ED8885B